MSALATLRCWWRAIIERSRIHTEVEEEFHFHIDTYAQDLVKQGMRFSASRNLPTIHAAPLTIKPLTNSQSPSRRRACYPRW